MSVNLHLAVTVRGYQPDRTPAVRRAIQEVIEAEELAEDLPPLMEVVDATGRHLTTRSDPHRPVVISGAYEWATRVEKTLREAAGRANGGPCQVVFRWDDADEGREDPDDEGDDD